MAEPLEIRRHNSDEYAHGPALEGMKLQLSAMQKFQERAIGGLIVLATLLSGGLLVALGHEMRIF